MANRCQSADFLCERKYCRKVCLRCGDIQIYQEIVDDEYLDTFNLLKERGMKKNQILHEYRRQDFAEIYLFFDYDGHSTLADDGKLKKLLEYFDDETDKGKLYVSYPMAEALKHISCFEDFKDLTVPGKENASYKDMVAKTCLPRLIQYKKYDFETWKQLIEAHLKKMNFVVTDSFSFPIAIVGQSSIFSNQLEKYINAHSTVAVLSAFPVFLHDYYGNDGIKRLVGHRYSQE